MNLNKLGKILIVGISIALWICLLRVSWNHMSADASYISAQRFIKKGEFEKAFVQANKSIEKNPKEARYYYGLAKTQLTNVQIAKNLTEQETLNEQALKNLLKSENLNPNNLVTLRNNIPLYYFLTQEGTNSEYLETTKNYYKKMKETYPNDLGVLTLLAKYENKLKLTKEFKQTKEMVSKLRPDILKWHPNFN